MVLFDNGETEEFFFFVWNFQMNLKTTGTIDASEEIQYLCTLLRGEAFHQQDMLYVEVVSTTVAYLSRTILSLGA